MSSYVEEAVKSNAAAASNSSVFRAPGTGGGALLDLASRPEESVDDVDTFMRCDPGDFANECGVEVPMAASQPRL